MTRRGCLVLVLVLGCGLFNRDRSKPKRTATPPKGLRTPSSPRGPMLAADPTPAPTLATLLREGGLVGVSDGIGGIVDDDGAHAGEVAWLVATLTRGADDDEARTLIKIRRAAFGTHVPAAGDRGVLDDDVLDDRGLGIDAAGVALVGSEGPCLARRGPAVVTALEVGGHAIDVRWPLLDCGPGPWAPLGLVAARIPTSFRWDPPRCDDEDPAVLEAWASTDAGDATRLGALRDGRMLVGLVGHDAGGGRLWIAGDGDWHTRTFTLAGKAVIGCAPPVAAPAIAESSDG